MGRSEARRCFAGERLVNFALWRAGDAGFGHHSLASVHDIAFAFVEVLVCKDTLLRGDRIVDKLEQVVRVEQVFADRFLGLERCKSVFWTIKRIASGALTVRHSITFAMRSAKVDNSVVPFFFTSNGANRAPVVWRTTQVCKIFQAKTSIRRSEYLPSANGLIIPGLSSACSVLFTALNTALTKALRCAWVRGSVLSLGAGSAPTSRLAASAVSKIVFWSALLYFTFKRSDIFGTKSGTTGSTKVKYGRSSSSVSEPSSVEDSLLVDTASLALISGGVADA